MAKKKNNNAALPHLNGQWLMAEDRVRDLFGRVQAAAQKIDYPDDDPTMKPDEPEYEVSRAGVATLEVIGVLTKYASWMDEYCGFCPTDRLAACLNRAVADPNVKAIDLLVDSLGGMVDGTTLFAEAVANADKIKPVYARVSDQCASGGMWIASQARHITANDTAFVGCIGVYTVLVDSAKFWSEMGVEFTVVSSGGVKGAGADRKVTPELVADVQREINGTYERFVAVIAQGRGMSDAEARKLADGRSWIANEAKKLGLIDEVASPEAAMKAITKEVIDMTKEQFMSSLAEHPEWVAGEREQGKALGAKETRDFEKARLAALREACGGNDSLACDLFAGGKDENDAKVVVAAIAKSNAKAEADAKAHAEALAAKDAEIEKLKAEKGTQPGVGTAGAASEANKGGGAAPERPTSSDPKAQKDWAKASAGHEWDNNPDTHKGFSAKENYVNWRAAELLGQARVISK